MANNDKSLEDKFKENLEQWRNYVKEHGIHISYTQQNCNCDAYRNIVALGKQALPLMRKAYDTEIGDYSKREGIKRLLFFPVKDILGNDFKIPKDIMDSAKKMNEYTKKWLDENIGKFVR